MDEKEKEIKTKKISLLCKCLECIYWNPHDKDKEVRYYCSYYNCYFFPSEMNECKGVKDMRR